MMQGNARTNTIILGVFLLVLGLAQAVGLVRAEGEAKALDPAPDVSHMADLVVMAHGRMKPLATYTRETMREYLGKNGANPYGSALDAYASMLFEPRAWHDRRWIEAGPEIAHRLFESKTRLSPAEVMEAHKPLSRLISDHSDRSASAEGRELAEQAVHLLNCAFTYSDLEAQLLLLPAPGTDTDEWVSVKDIGAAKDSVSAPFEDLLKEYDVMKAAYLSGEAAAFNKAVDQLIALQRSEKGAMLSQDMVTLENLYYAVDVKFVGLILFSLAGLCFVLNLFFRKPLFKALTLLGLCAGVLWNAWIVGGRTAIGGRLPLKNLQEVYLVVLFFVPLIGLLLHKLFKNSLYTGVAAILSVIGYIGALHLDPAGYDIAPLVAILMSPWREVHILTIMLSYAILLVAFGLDLAYLALVFMRRMEPAGSDREAGLGRTADELHHKAYLVLAWGFLFLTVGITTGAAWAHSSWGRYWGWDPKEVWATVAWAIYALFLHLRLFFPVKKVWLAAINIIGFAAIMFTYFGVTYLLSGLHAYR